ncbi:unnamed protein product [Plutella xylostella]|uniref:(diamondback moth) hypothetical protein n=1 Tax=Plutella xylostella TaxID=51655 RepID=A0A8S4GA52_PLUXY|nr:unnamed protein product [Plutella xylostella]
MKLFVFVLSVFAIMAAVFGQGHPIHFTHREPSSEPYHSVDKPVIAHTLHEPRVAVQSIVNFTILVQETYYNVSVASWTSGTIPYMAPNSPVKKDKYVRGDEGGGEVTRSPRPRAHFSAAHNSQNYARVASP